MGDGDPEDEIVTVVEGVILEVAVTALLTDGVTLVVALFDVEGEAVSLTVADALFELDGDPESEGDAVEETVGASVTTRIAEGEADVEGDADAEEVAAGLLDAVGVEGGGRVRVAVSV